MSPHKPPRVALDLTPLPRSKAGVGRYAFGLLRGLSPYVSSGDLDLVCIAKSNDVAEVATTVPGAQVVEVGDFRLGRPARLAWEQAVLPGLLRKTRADLFHGIHYSLPLASGIPSAVVFHDPTFWTHPELHSRAKVAYFRTIARFATRKAHLVFTVSEWSGRQLSAILALDPDRVRVAYHGVDEFLFEPESTEALGRMRRELGAEGRKLVAFVGTIEPRKNLPRLSMAVELLRDRMGEPGVVLAVAGQKGWKTGETEAWMTRGRRRGWLVELGYVDEVTKRALYQAADAVAYVSLAEGFGIPVLEAFASGTPVVTSDRTATAEVAGNAAILVDPYDVGSIADGLARVLTDDEASARLVAQGKARAAEFDWSEAARRTLEGWLDCLSHRRSEEVHQRSL